MTTPPIAKLYMHELRIMPDPRVDSSRSASVLQAYLEMYLSSNFDQIFINIYIEYLAYFRDAMGTYFGVQLFRRLWK